MEDFTRIMLINKSTRENLLAEAKAARLAHLARPTPTRRLGVVIAATAILLGMILVLALVF
jgi:hypothetical protein